MKMNHKFNKSDTLEDLEKFLEQSGAKEITRILFLKDKVKVEFK
jgi:hypothetical protein